MVTKCAHLILAKDARYGRQVDTGYTHMPEAIQTALSDTWRTNKETHKAFSAAPPHWVLCLEYKIMRLDPCSTQRESQMYVH